jgi:uncharacterized RDD family membrane protein YckC
MTNSIQRILCPSCGDEYQPNFRICPGCGTDLSGGASVSSARVTQKVIHANTTITPTAAPPQRPQMNDSLTDAWPDAPVAPWRRWAARLLDLNVNGVVAVFAFFFIFASIAPYEANKIMSLANGPGGVILDSMFTILLGSLLTGLIIGLTGSSLGKVIFGIRVTKLDGALIGPVDAMARELHILLMGMGLGIPLVNLATMVFAYNRLKYTGSTSWDQRAFRVTYRPNGKTQYLLNAFGLTLFIIVLFAMAMLRQASYEA